jgi:pimeloyl-ACP methyl ester carboxylesterase
VNVNQQLLKVNYRGVTLDVAAYVSRRSADWVFCIHGLQSNSELFRELIEQPFLSKYSTIAVDLVGFGKSSKPLDFSYNVEDQAQVIQEIFKILKIRRAVLIGHSLGGMVGVLLLESLAEILSGFVNMEGNLVLSDCGASKLVVLEDFADFKEHGYAKLKEQVAKESPLRAAWLNDIPDYVFYNTSQSIVNLSKSEKLVGLFGAATCRRLFVCGDKNVVKVKSVPPSVPSRLISNAGHFMLLDNPTESNTCLEEFFHADKAAETSHTPFHSR